ncbi:MAG: redoxin domain-containing protein [Candidatus Dormibacteraeota bacterium]|nr:redoxin domain-containing protein [Candidatus Dormibacteraeota bacterium]
MTVRTMNRTLGILVVAAITGLSLLAAFVGLHSRAGSGGGTLLVALSSRSGDSLHETQIQIHSARGGWSSLAHFGGGAIPSAPNIVTAVQADVSPGAYDAIRLDGQDLTASIRVVNHRVEPVLITVDAGAPAAAFAGNDGYNSALLALQGKLLKLPDFKLVDQEGKVVTASGLRGAVVVVAAFHTTCRDTCPLYTAVLSQLRSRLPEVHLLEVSTDPEHDSPAALQDHAALVAASWPLLSGSREQLAAFWGTFGVQLSGADSHSNFLGVFDQDGYLRHTETGVPDPGSVPGGLGAVLSPEGVRQLAGHGDGWGAAQVADAIRSANSVAMSSLPGGSPAPDFAAPNLDGGTLSSRQFRGHPMVLNFWSSTCPPCRREMPMIQSEAARAGANVLLVDVRDEAPAARAFLKRVGVHQPSAVDSDGRVAALYGVNVLPVTIFIRADGTIEGKYLGETTQAVLRDHLAALSARN